MKTTGNAEADVKVVKLDLEWRCRGCGQVTRQELEVPDLLAPTLMKLAERGDLCEACAGKRCEARMRQLATEWAERRRQAWEQICPVGYRDTRVATLRRLLGEETLARIWDWTWGPKGLVFVGPTRSCKTRSCYKLLEREFQVGRDVMVMTHFEFAVAATHQEPAALARWVRRLASVDILFVDDLGKGKLARADGAGSQAEEVLHGVFELRISRGLPTFWTTERTGRELEARFSAERGPAFVARLREFSTTVLTRKTASQASHTAHG